VPKPTTPKTEVLSIDDLISDPANPRVHPERNRKAVAGSVRRFKPWRSIAIDQGNVIYAGNETANACKEAGYTSVLVVEPEPGQLVAVRRRDMTETEKTGYAIADNQTAVSAEWAPELPAALQSLEMDGFDLKDLGFDEDELEEFLSSPENVGPEPAPEAQIDRAAELQEKWATERGQLWEIGRHRLLCGDSANAEDVARVMGGVKAQGSFTSPPYAEQRKAQYGGTPADRYVDWWEAIQANIRANLKDDGSFFVNIKAHCEDGERHLYVLDLVAAMNRRWGWRYIDEFAWLRKGVPGGWANRFKNAWEPVHQFSVGGEFKIRIANVMVPSAVARGTHSPSKKEWKRHAESAFKSFDDSALEARPSNVLDFKDSEPGVLHSAPFPVRLPTWFIEAYSDAGDTWLEPFCGSGTTMVAAEQTGRLCRGIEIEPKYVAVILERLTEMGLEPRLLVN
jgi:DNA modification methylase